jgi:hypothetical protein
MKPMLVSAVVRKAPVPEELSLTFDLRDASWSAYGPIGLTGLSPAALDLVEIARVVWEVERNTPKRISSQRVRDVRVRMPLRRPETWTAESLQQLTAILRLLGNAEWSFQFTKRRGLTALDTAARSLVVSNLGADCVALFSGGLDSTCGLGWLRREHQFPILVSFYGSKLKQVDIARALGFDRHFQLTCTWSGGGRRRFGGQFQYRSFLFLTLGAAIAASCEAETLYQFENGPLAISLPPSATYRMTRHAHPRLHLLAGRLFSSVLQSKFRIVNPFLLQTKFESVNLLRGEVRKPTFVTVVGKTESCWNLKSRHVVGAIIKSVGQPCGLCIPCLVRRSALRRDDFEHAVDFTKKTGKHFSDANARVHVDAYRIWAQSITDPRYSFDQFLAEMPYVVRDAVTHSNGALTDMGVFILYQRFATEILATFPSP